SMLIFTISEVHMAQNLTKDFLELRNRMRRPRRHDKDLEEVEPFLKTNGDDTQKRNVSDPSPSWIVISASLKIIFSKIRTEIKKLSNYHSERLNPIFDAKLEKKLEAKIENLSQTISKYLEQAENNVKKISIFENGAPKNNSVFTNLQDEKTIRLNSMRFNANILRKMTNAFQKQERYFFREMSAQKSDETKESKQVRSKNSFEFDDFILNSNDGEDLFANRKLTKTRENETRDEKDIKRIAKRTESLSRLFGELGSLVIDQRSKLDRIDFAIENSVDNIQSAVDELEITKRNQLKSKSSMIIFWLIVAIAVCLIILILK
ncbi:hypothetical protein MHBO_003618, partial [Bonamia ostreae]